MAAKKNKADAKKKMIQLVALILAGLMVISVVGAAIFSQV